MRNKYIAVGLLATLLLMVLLRPTGQSPSSESTSVCDGYASPVNLPALTAKSTFEEQSILPLPVVDLKVLLAHDPFRANSGVAPELTSSIEASVVQTSLATTEVTPSSQTAIEQREIPVSAIVTGGKRSAALIGEQLYYENDVLANGWQIVAIKSSSILVQSTQN